jgi:hypothetical protein
MTEPVANDNDVPTAEADAKNSGEAIPRCQTCPYWDTSNLPDDVHYGRVQPCKQGVDFRNGYDTPHTPWNFGCALHPLVSAEKRE